MIFCIFLFDKDTEWIHFLDYIFTRIWKVKNAVVIFYAFLICLFYEVIWLAIEMQLCFFHHEWRISALTDSWACVDTRILAWTGLARSLVWVCVASAWRWEHWRILWIFYIDISINELWAEAFDQKFSFSHWEFCSCFLDLKIINIINLFLLHNIGWWQKLFLRSSCDEFHKSYDASKWLLIFLNRRILFLGTKKDEFWVFLTSSTFHLDERLDCQQFVETNDLITCWNIKAFLNDICSNQYVQQTLLKLL